MWSTTNRIIWIAAIVLMFHAGLAAQQLRNWVAHIEPCEQSRDLAKHDHMELGVWMNTSNSALELEFGRALDFWSHIVDLAWHKRNSSECAIQVVDGSSSLFTTDLIAARSQLVDRQLFNGWIAFN